MPGLPEWSTVPACQRPAWSLRNARLDDAGPPVTIHVDGDRISAVAPDDAQPGEAGERLWLDAGGRRVLACPVDVHTHLDKTGTLARSPNPTGTLDGALLAGAADQERYWSAEDLAGRMDAALERAWRNGTRALRTHLTANPAAWPLTWPAFLAARQRWAGRIELQGASLQLLEHLLAGDPQSLARSLAEGGGILGCAVLRETAALPEQLDALLQLAAQYDLEVDIHADEHGDPSSRALHRIAEAALRNGFTRPLTVSHCCNLARQGEDEVAATAGLLLEAGAGFVCLPQTNLYLQDHVVGRTPRWRGIAPVRELQAAGVPVAFASDNVVDAFNPIGDYDLLDVLRHARIAAHWGPGEADWLAPVTTTPAALMRLADDGLVRAGGKADFIIVDACSDQALLARAALARIVVRNGRPLAAANCWE